MRNRTDRLFLAFALAIGVAGCGADASQERTDTDHQGVRCDKTPNHPRCDTVAPTVSISSPSDGATLSGVVTVTGTASDNRSLAKVELQVDGGAFQPASGTSSWSYSLDTAALANGSHTLTAKAVDSAGNNKSTSVSVNVSNTGTAPPPPGPSGTRGPQASITCPAGAVNISPGQDIPSIVNSHPTGTTFCVLAGTHYTTSPINLKTNDKLIGQFGAIIDGTNVTMTYDIGSTSIVRGWNCGTAECNGATVQNLVLRNLATHNCIGVYGPTSNNWTIDHNEMHGCHNGVNIGASSGARITNNYIHHNVGDPSAAEPSKRGGGYGAFQPKDYLWENNEIAYNGPEQKICLSENVTFRNNYVHHNVNDGIWYDGDNTGMLVEGNTVEDHGREGIFLEISAGGIVRNNIIRRSGNSGIFISTSRDIEMYDNTLEDNFRGIQYFLNCDAVNGGAIGWDLSNNNAHDNIIKVGTTAGSIATGLSHLGSCSATAVVPYLNGSKNNVYQNNHYYTPTTTGTWWFWAPSWRSWSQWQALPQDVGSTLELSSAYTGSTPPPSGGADTTKPVVSISSPPESAVVSGTTTVVVNASDNVGVVGVQLKVDGVAVGPEDLTSPFSISWVTTAYSNGNHTLSAVARDAAGNTATSTGHSVTVSN